MSRKLNRAYAVLILVGGFVATYLSYPPFVRGASVAPFTVQQTNLMVAGKNDPAEVFDSTFARRGDESWSHAFTSADLSGVRRRVLEYVDMQSLISVHSEPRTQSIMTMHLPLAELSREAPAGFTTCSGLDISDGSQHSTILGFDVVQVVVYDALGTEVKWVAPVLDCYPLYSAFTGPNGERTIEVVTKVQEGEPSRDLFVPPVGYVERSPKEIQALYAETSSATEFLPDDMLNLVEKRYKAAQILHQ